MRILFGVAWVVGLVLVATASDNPIGAVTFSLFRLLTR